MTTVRASRGIVLRQYVVGIPQPTDFELRELPTAEPQQGEVLVQTHYLSMDPAPRMRMDAAAKFPPPMRLGQVVAGRGVGIVIASKFAGLKVGDAVLGELGWQEYATLPGSQLRSVDPKTQPLQASLGILGASGITAWFLTREAGRVQAGDTVVIAAAAGSVGSVAVQLARLAGARVVAIVGGAQQARFVRDDLSADATVDYQSSQLDAELAAACPAGANVFLDSVGGSLHNAVMAHIADRARIVVFGFIASYDSVATSPQEYGRIYQVIRRRAELRGFLIGDYAPHFGAALAELRAGLKSGALKNFEQCRVGLEQAPTAFAALFSGEPIGKQLVRVI